MSTAGKATAKQLWSNHEFCSEEVTFNIKCFKKCYLPWENHQITCGILDKHIRSDENFCLSNKPHKGPLKLAWSLETRNLSSHSSCIHKGRHWLGEDNSRNPALLNHYYILLQNMESKTHLKARACCFEAGKILPELLHFAPVEQRKEQLL